MRDMRCRILTILFVVLIMLPALVACGKTQKGEGYEISNERIEITSSGSDADVVIKGTLTNTLKVEEMPAISYSIYDEAGERIAFAIYYAGDMPAGSSVDFETTMVPILPGWSSSYKEDDFEQTALGAVTLPSAILSADPEEVTKAWKDVCQNAKSYKLDGVFFTKSEAAKAQREADEVQKQVEREQQMKELTGKN